MKNIKKIIICIFFIIMCGIIIFFCTRNQHTSKKSIEIILPDSYSRESYLNLQGWDVEEEQCSTITIPENFNDTYKEYALIQEKQGLPLKNYTGEQAQRFLYSINNYNSSQTVYAELILCNDRLIAASLIGYTPESFIKEIY